jgi:hypothetical protein
MHCTLQGWAAKHGNDPSYLREVDIFISAFDTVKNKKGSQPMYILFLEYQEPVKEFYLLFEISL